MREDNLLAVVSLDEFFDIATQVFYVAVSSSARRTFSTQRPDTFARTVYSSASNLLQSGGGPYIFANYPDEDFYKPKFVSSSSAACS
jgi:hypothetical protein